MLEITYCCVEILFVKTQNKRLAIYHSLKSVVSSTVNHIFESPILLSI